jgi:hypothetical protein
MKNSTYSRRSQIVSTVKKSQARMPAACWRRNARVNADRTKRNHVRQLEALGYRVTLEPAA